VLCGILGVALPQVIYRELSGVLDRIAGD